MHIAGFQPLSLVDFPGHSASIVFTQGCVFRCAYCHNPELIPITQGQGMPETDVLAYLEKHKAMIDGVVITGGEPTIQSGLLPFIVELKRLGFKVKLDTNGIHPLFVESLIKENLLDYVAMDLKHTWEKYETVIRSQSTRSVENCRKTFEMLQRSGVDHEFRTTVCPGMHTEDDILAMGRYLKPGERYYLQAVQFKKNLEPGLLQTFDFDLIKTTEKFKELYPEVEIGVR